MKKYKETLVVAIIIVVIGLYFQIPYLNKFPSHIHAWAQTDRYALALGFTNNHLNLFKPETFTLNHLFPDNWAKPSEQSITSVDFPIHSYIPAVLMKITGNYSPLLFRLYILLYSFFGLLFLYRLSRLIQNNFFKSVLVVVFAATSPLFVYYQGGFLASVPSLANAIIGTYFYFNFLRNNNHRHFKTAIIFLTIAALSRIAFIIPLFSVFAIEFFTFLKKRDTAKHKILPVTLSIISLAAYFFYNQYLGKTYGSVFLSQINPALGLSEISNAFSLIYERWGTIYFSGFHYLLIAGFLLSGISFYYKKLVTKTLIKNEVNYLAILFTGCFLLMFLMLLQLPDHDYYFLDTFYLPFILLFAFSLTIIPEIPFKNKTAVKVSAVLLISIPLMLSAKKIQTERNSDKYWDRTEATTVNFTGADKLLDSLNISKDARMLVIDAYVPNTPFILMNRKGYAIMSTKKEAIEDALTWDYDYIVVQNEFFISDIYSSFPEILEKIRKIADNGKISICRFEESKNQNLIDFLGLKNKKPMYSATINFDTTAGNFWSNTDTTMVMAYSGKCSGILTPDKEYGLTFKSKNIEVLNKKTALLFVETQLFHDTINDLFLVASINNPDSTIYYRSYNLSEYSKNYNSWGNNYFLFQLPKTTNSDNELAIYFWNKGKNKIIYDDFSINIY